MNKLMVATLMLLLALGGAMLFSPAQTSDAALLGTITDKSGGVLPGVTVTATNKNTGVAQSTLTNDAGIYSFPALQPGEYHVTAELPSFSKFGYTVQLQVGDKITRHVTLEVGSPDQAIEVSADSQPVLQFGNNSIGSIVTGRQVLELPLNGRNALDLVFLQPGLVGGHFSGNRIGTLNLTLDGINVQDNRINSGVASTVGISVERVEEFRVITSPADAELGRGSGQIQAITRSGTNQFHGSLYEFHRNTALNANTWFNNQRGLDPLTGSEISPRNNLLRNQFGGRIGGPIIRNRTFFHATYEGQRIVTKDAVTSTVYTEKARQGIFRFFPGARNANANSTSADAPPVVDLRGNPLRPSTATGDLREVNVFTRAGSDTTRRGFDPTGSIQQFIARMPLPNNFRAGDGLNTAGYTWARRGTSDFDQLTFKLDHHFNSAHRISGSYSFQDVFLENGFMAQNYPDSPGGNQKSREQSLAINLTSTLRPNLLNELRVGYQMPRIRFTAPFEGAGRDRLPKLTNYPYLPTFGIVTNPINSSNDPQGRVTPVYEFANNMTWTKSRHSFKGGIDLKFVNTNGFNSFNVVPRVNFGTGIFGNITGISNIPGIGFVAGTAHQLLNELSGSIGTITEAFNSPGGPNPTFVLGESKRRDWHQSEISLFFKDDFKVKPNLTLNLGLRWEYYGVPYESNGRAVSLVGGHKSIFGISGTSIGDLYQPGNQAGSLTREQLIGPKTPNPKGQLYRDDYNNFGPAVGFSWAPGFLGGDKTVLRAGYQVGYERNALRNIDIVSGDQPGLRTVPSFSINYLDLTGAVLPLTPRQSPLALTPITERQQIIRTYDDNLRTPYVQNWNFSIQRELARNTVLDIRYVGSKGTKLIRGTDINEANIFTNGILEAFLITQQGGNAPLLDRIFDRVNVGGIGAVGVTRNPDGTLLTGSQLMRRWSTTYGYFANNNVGAFANFLNNLTTAGGDRGVFLRRAGLPENFITGNPQFASARYFGNLANSTYHSLQIEIQRRFTAGLYLQANYTFSKALGEEEGDGQELESSYRNARNRRLDKRILSFNRTHVVRANGLYELPIGPGQRFLSGSNTILAKVLGGWQINGIFTIFSGDPITIGSGLSTFNQFGEFPVVAGKFDRGRLGQLRRTSNGVIYFPELRQVQDPYVQSISTADGLQGRSTLRAITDANGQLLFVNPRPGELGTLAPLQFEGPGSVNFTFSTIKRTRIAEGKEIEFRAEFFQIFNNPNFSDPETNINSANFGRIGSADSNRIIQFGLRFNF